MAATNSIIGPDDPPVVTLLNEEGSARVLLVADHASNRIPGTLNNLGLDALVLEQHVAYDIGTRKLVTHLSQHLDAPAVVAGYSRLVVDLNRSLADSTLMPEVSDGIVIPGNQAMTPEHRAERVHTIYTPYREAIDATLYGMRTADSVPAFVSIHSFTPQMAGEGQRRPWHVGMMWDKDPRIALPMLKRLRAHPDNFHVGDNLPYSGKHEADYTIDHHAEAAGLPHVAIEIRQDLVNTEDGAERWSVILHEALEDILAEDSLYCLWEGM